MLKLLQLVAFVLASGVVLTLLSEGFALAVSRVMEAAFDRIEFALALRARRRQDRERERRRMARLNHTRDAAEGVALDQEQTTT